MGMYTGLRCRLVLKDEVVEEIKNLLNPSLDLKWCDIPSTDPFREAVYNKWGEIDRSEMIPFGGLHYMPWNDNDPLWQNRIELVEGKHIWIFQCSLKNYESEIESFFKIIIPIIAKDTQHIEVLYEEWEVSELYEFYDGAVKALGDGIRYSGDDDSFL